MNPLRSGAKDNLTWLDPVRYATDPVYQRFALDRMSGQPQTSTFEMWQRGHTSVPAAGPATAAAPTPTPPQPTVASTEDAARFKALRVKADPSSRRDSDIEERGERYMTLLAEKRLPDTDVAKKDATAALAGLASKGTMTAFAPTWDDLALRLGRGALQGAPHLTLIKQYLRDMTDRRLDIAKRSALIVDSNALLVHDLEMARFIARSTVTKPVDVEYAHRLVFDLTQRLLSDAKVQTKGSSPDASALTKLPQAVKFTYSAEGGQKLLREVAAPGGYYLVGESAMRGRWGKVRYALGPAGEKLIARVTRLHHKGEGFTLPMTIDEVMYDNKRLVRANSPLAPKEVVVVNDKIIAFQKRYAGNVLDLLVGLKDHADMPEHGVHPLRNALVLYCFQHIAAEVMRAHDLGILHRDIKPDNMFYSPDAPPALKDYRVASIAPRNRLANGEFTVPFDTLRGSSGYMAPEVLYSDAASYLTEKADVFSFGASLAYMTAYNVNDIPFSNVTTAGEMLRAIDTYRVWRRHRTVDGTLGGRIDWQKVSAGNEPLDRQARCMHTLGAAFADTVLAMLFPDPHMRPSMKSVAAVAEQLVRAAKLDQAALSRVMVEAQKLNPASYASEVAVDKHEGRLRSEAEVSAERDFAEALLSARQFPQAEPYLRNTVLSRFVNAEDHYRLAYAFDSQGNLDDAMGFYVNAVKSNPEEPWYKFHAGQAYAKDGRFNFARRFLKDAVQTAQPDDPDAERYAQALADLPARIQKVKDEEAAAKRAKADADETQKAQAAQQEAQRQWQLGTNMVQRNDTTMAEKYFREALKAAPDNAKFNYSFGVLLQAQERTIEAQGPLLKAADLDPSNGLHNYAAGMVLLSLDDAAKAEPYFKRAVDSEPRNTVYLRQLGEYLVQQDKPLTAEPHFRRATRADASDARNWGGLGKALLRQGNLEAGAAASLRAVRLDPTNAGYNYQLGITQKLNSMLSNPLAAARPYLEEALRLEPGNRAYRVELHNCLFRMGYKSDAKKLLK